MTKDIEIPKYIEIETSRFCNRKCTWCPNASMPTRSTQELMHWDTFISIISYLGYYDYASWLAFHNYNEPLANERILEELRHVRHHLPNAKPVIYTNGDLLDERIFNNLISGGLAQLRVTLYPRESENSIPSANKLWQWVNTKKIFLKNLNWTEKAVPQGLALCSDFPFQIMLISPDVNGYYDRGGALPHLSIYSRTSSCHLTSNSLSIDYLGNVKMCCNIVTDHAQHDKYFFGSSTNADPILIWNSDRFKLIRERHLVANWTDSPVCKFCRQELR